MNQYKRCLNILLVTPQLPYPPHQGTSLRNFHILRGLAQQHNVHLLSFREEGQSDNSEALKRLQAECELIRTVPSPERTLHERLYRLFVDARPDMAHRLQSPQLERALYQMLQERIYDVVQIEGIELAHIIPVVRRIRPESNIVFDDHNAEAELQHRAFLTDAHDVRRWPLAAYSYIQTRRLRRYEAWACRATDAVSVVSKADRQHLQKLVPDLEPVIIPNCIDVEAYRSFHTETIPYFDLVFSGKMDYRPNVDAALWFAQEIWPLLRARRPKLSWAIVGQKPHTRLDFLRDVPGVSLIGFVPDIKPYLLGAKVYVMPFRMGSGTRLKLIEAMASGKAVVSTRIGAEGYPIKHGEELLVADGVLHFAGAILTLLSDEQRRLRLGQKAQKFAADYDWRQVIPRFYEIYDRLDL